MPDRTSNKRRRVTVQTPTETKDSYGQMLQTWGTYATRYARKRDLVGREYYQSQQTISQVTTQFTFRYDTLTKAIDTKMRINDSGTIYDIESVIDLDDKHRDIIVMGVLTHG